jgi:hypothetical protein
MKKNKPILTKKLSNKIIENNFFINKLKLINYLNIMSFNIWESAQRFYKGIEMVAEVIINNEIDIGIFIN